MSNWLTAKCLFLTVAAVSMSFQVLQPQETHKSRSRRAALPLSSPTSRKPFVAFGKALELAGHVPSQFRVIELRLRTSIWLKSQLVVNSQRSP